MWNRGLAANRILLAARSWRRRQPHEFPLRSVDGYLHEAALADNPPSGTFYDPNHPTATTRLASLGAHEHWNNAQDKQNSRNLGKRDGIELVRVEGTAARWAERAPAMELQGHRRSKGGPGSRSC